MSAAYTRRRCDQFVTALDNSLANTHPNHLQMSEAQLARPRDTTGDLHAEVVVQPKPRRGSAVSRVECALVEDLAEPVIGGNLSLARPGEALAYPEYDSDLGDVAE